MRSNSEAVPQRAGSISTGFARYSRQLISDHVRVRINKNTYPTYVIALPFTDYVMFILSRIDLEI